jgi:methylmalonyl-CoA mutase N-terminal domain/subunit
VDAFVPQISFFFNAHSDFFEEIAVAPPGRSGLMRCAAGSARRTSARKPRFHSQTGVCSPPSSLQQRVRTAPALGGPRGTNSLHTNSLDEALALLTAEAATPGAAHAAIIACESGVVNVVDPLGGRTSSRLTRDMEDGALYFDAIDKMGGMVEAIGAASRRRKSPRAASLSAGVEQGKDHGRRQCVRPGERPAD